MGIVHWDDIERHRAAKGEMDATWQQLGKAAGAVGIGVNRMRVAPGRLPTPPHSHGASEEIYYVLDGTGLAWQDEQVGTRMGYYEDSIAPDKMWLISSNGDHHTDNAPFLRETMKRFYARFLKGESNGFEHTPRVLLAQEMQWMNGGGDYGQLRPSAVASFDRLPVRVTPAVGRSPWR